MMKLPTIKFVFNRRKNATKKHPASVELRIGQGLKCKYLATGIRLLPKEWGHDRVTNRPDYMELVAVVVIEYFHRACDGIEWCQLTCEALVDGTAGSYTNLGFVGFTCLESRHSEDNIATLKYSLLQSKCLPMFDEENKKVAEGLTLFNKYFRNLRD